MTYDDIRTPEAQRSAALSDSPGLGSRREKQAEPKSPSQEEFRLALRRAGIVVHWPSGKPVLISERNPVKLHGTPLSEQIIADRR